MNEFELEALQITAVPKACPYCKSEHNDLYYSRHHNGFICQDCCLEDLRDIDA